MMFRPSAAAVLLLALLLLPFGARAQRPDSLVVLPADSGGVPAAGLPVFADSLRPALSAGAAYRPLVPRSTSLLDFAYADSLTQTLWAAGRWTALDSVGRAALAVGTDYPALRQRLGDAALRQERLTTALRHYGRALQANPADEHIRAQLALTHLLLGQRDAATYHARLLPDSVRGPLHLLPRIAVRDLALELGGTDADTRRRSSATFGHLSAASQLTARLVLAQTVAYYGQTVQLPDARSPASEFTVRQWEYHALLRAQLAARWQARLGYHYLHNIFGTQRYPGHLVYAAAVYAHPAWQAHLGLYAGRLTDTARTQLDAQLTWYPRGNLRLYTFGRGTVVRSGGRTYPNALLGLGQRLGPRAWLEGFVGLGRVPVLAEADGQYVYNLLDPLHRRLGLTAYCVLPHQLRLQLRYVLENRFLTPFITSYTQFALTGGLAWTW